MSSNDFKVEIELNEKEPTRDTTIAQIEQNNRVTIHHIETSTVRPTGSMMFLKKNIVGLCKSAYSMIAYAMFVLLQFASLGGILYGFVVCCQTVNCPETTNSGHVPSGRPAEHGHGGE
jgi:hypothetical protein